MLLDDVIAKLGGSGIGLTNGTNLFAGTLPDSPDSAVAVYETGGIFPLHTMNVSAGKAVAERPRVQIVSRGMRYQAARQTAHLISQTLDGLNNDVINGNRYLQITAVSSPAAMGLDASGRIRLTQSFDIIKALHTSTSTAAEAQGWVQDDWV